MSLQSYVSSFEIQTPASRPVAGAPIDLSAVPTEILDVPTFEVVTGNVDLNVVLKHVELPPEAGVTPWPPDATATSVVSNITSGLATAPSAGAIEGWLALIEGTVPIGTNDISDQIKIDLRWEFTDERGDTLSDIHIVSGAVDAPSLSIAVPPVVSELTTSDFSDAFQNQPTSRRIGIQLVVRGRVGTTQDTGDVRVPASPILLEIISIPLPSVAALFRGSQLGGDAVFVTVPNGSPVGSVSSILNVLNPLRNLLGTVNNAATAASWATGTRGLLAAVDGLAQQLPLKKHVGFKAQNQNKDLGKYNFIEVNNWFNKDIEDRASSCLVVSASQNISFFEHDNFKGKELTLVAAPQTQDCLGGAVVRQLHVSVPESDPPGCVQSSGKPGGGNWGDVISSYRWASV